MAEFRKVPVRRHRRRDGVYVRAHERTIKKTDESGNGFKRLLPDDVTLGIPGVASGTWHLDKYKYSK